MAAVFSTMGVAALLAVLHVLQPPVGADIVTVTVCDNPGRIRHYAEDREATMLSLSDCDITDDIFAGNIRGLPNLKFITAHHNSLRFLPVFGKDTCSKLRELDVYKNKLVGIYDANTFKTCKKLENIDLSSNNIEYINQDVFKPLIELRELELQSNKIKFIPDSMFSNNVNLKHLSLEYNMITYLPINFASNLMQASPKVEQLTFYGMTSWNCACLLEHLADVKRAGVPDYKTWYKYNDRRVECVITAVPCLRLPAPEPRDLRANVTAALNL